MGQAVVIDVTLTSDWRSGPDLALKQFRARRTTTTIRKASLSARKPGKALTSRESPPTGVPGPFINYSCCM